MLYLVIYYWLLNVCDVIKLWSTRNRGIWRQIQTVWCIHICCFAHLQRSVQVGAVLSARTFTWIHMMILNKRVSPWSTVAGFPSTLTWAEGGGVFPLYASHKSALHKFWSYFRVTILFEDYSSVVAGQFLAIYSVVSYLYVCLDAIHFQIYPTSGNCTVQRYKAVSGQFLLDTRLTLGK